MGKQEWLRGLLLGGCLLVALTSTGCRPRYPNCRHDDQCHEGERCVQGRCQQCATDADCGAGRACRAGACEAIPGYCASDADCGPGSRCENHRCTSAAEASTDPGDSRGGASCELTPPYFEFDESRLTDDARRALAADATCLRQRGAGSVLVTGMCDPRGTEEYNMALGDRRAQSTTDYLRNLGIASSSLRSRSVGEERSTGTDEAGWALDRRAELSVE